MAKVHSDLPPKIKGHITEHLESLSLKQIDSDKVHLWFNLCHIPEVNDTDILLFHEHLGLFIIEQKGVDLNQIESFSYAEMKIKGRHRGRTPQAQAREAMIALKNFLSPKIKSLPWITPTVFWPKITREQWIEYWDISEIKNLANRMLFNGDITSGSMHLDDKLSYILQHPPIGKGSSNSRNYNGNAKEIIENLNKHIFATAYPVKTKSDTERLEKIEGNVRSEVKREFPQPFGHYVVFQGHPGTGKTFRLLELAIHYIRQNFNVLYLCYNKVLATDLRRLINLSSTFEQFPNASKCIKIADIFQFISLYGAQFDITITESTEGYNEWARLVIDELKKHSKILPQFDAILIDEAQDLPSWVNELIGLLAKPDAGTFIAQGKGQELYADQESSAIDWSINPNANIKQLKRVFRNSQPTYFVAQAFYDLAPKVAKLESLFEKFKSKQKIMSGLNLEFERKDSYIPSIRRVQDELIWCRDESDPDFPEFQDEVMIEEIKGIIQSKLKDLDGDSQLIDVLILVPDTSGHFTRWTTEALRAIENIEFIDYTNEENRRYYPSNGQIRLCTFHSSRGIEARHVILIGFESIEHLCKRLKRPISMNNLAYIVLSRSVFSTIVTKTSMFLPQTSFEFLENTLYYANKLV